MSRFRIAQTPAFLAAALCLALSSVGVTACREKQEASTSPIVTHEYVVRGIVAQLPDRANPASEFQVQHEAIPEFKGPGGQLGMNTMTMPFPLAKGLSLDALSAGDKIELTFVVDFDTQKDSPVGYRATVVKKLAPDVELDFAPLPSQSAQPESTGDQR